HPSEGAFSAARDGSAELATLEPGSERSDTTPVAPRCKRPSTPSPPASAIVSSSASLRELIALPANEQCAFRAKPNAREMAVRFRPSYIPSSGRRKQCPSSTDVLKKFAFTHSSADNESAPARRVSA